MTECEKCLSGQIYDTTFGSNVVIGASSVVTHDIPDGVVAFGNPCRVVREITEEDKAAWRLESTHIYFDHFPPSAYHIL